MRTIVTKTLLLVVVGLWLMEPVYGLVLVEDGKAKSVIITADEPSVAAQQGAEDVRTWIRKMSGAEVSIRKEGDAAVDPGLTRVFVGATQRAAAIGLRAADLDLEEFVVRTQDGALFIIGDDEAPDGRALRGTLWGVNHFAEEVLGVRVLWPGPSGEVAPQQKTVDVGDFNVREKPIFRQHVISDVGVYSHTEAQVAKLGWSRDEFVKHHAQSRLWYRFHKLGGSYSSHIGHGFNDYWTRFGKSHPEWFALQPDGTRDQTGVKENRARLCVSNPELVKQAAKDCIEQFKRNPNSQLAVISPTDNGGGTTYCVCENCEAMDAPDGKPIRFWTPEGNIPHVSLTDRFVKFWNGIAEIVAAEYPDRYLGAFAYDTYAYGPTQTELHPNIVIRFVQHRYAYVNEQIRQNARDSWLSWARAAKKLEYYSNGPMAGHHFPSVYVQDAAADMRLFADNNLFEPYVACVHQHWATNGLNYYLYAKLLWNPRRSAEKIVAEYCRAGFGPAAGPVRVYFDRLEAAHRDIAGTSACRGGSKRVGLYFAKYFDNAVLGELHSYLDEARDLGAGDEKILERINFLRRGIDYTAISRKYLLAKEALRNGEADAAARLAKISERRLQWFNDQGFNWAVNIALIMHYDL